MLPFDFVVPGVPISAQASRHSKERWKKDVLSKAQVRWPHDAAPINDELSAAIIYFSIDETALDVDNIAKPILDALIGLVYQDDVQLTQIVLRKTQLITGFRVREPSPVLAAAMEAGYLRDFVYIRISDGPDHAEVPR